MRQNGSFGILVFVIIAGLGGALAFLVNGIAGNVAGVGIGVVAFMVATIASSAIRIADQWDRAVIPRLGQFHALKGPGLFFMISVVDSIPYWSDIRVITTGFKAEMTALTMGLGQDRANGAPALPGRLPEQANGHQELPLK